MVDSPSSEESVVTTIDTSDQQIRNEEYLELTYSRFKIVTEHWRRTYDLVSGIAKLANEWHSIGDVNRKAVLAGRSISAVAAFSRAVRKLSEEHFERFHYDKSLKAYLLKVETCIVQMHGEDINDVEELLNKEYSCVALADPVETRAALQQAGDMFGSEIKSIGNYDHLANFLDYVLDQEFSEEQREEAECELFDELKINVLVDLNTQETYLDRVFEERITGADVNLCNGVSVLEFLFDKLIQSSEALFRVLENSHNSKFGKTNFVFLAQLKYLPKTGEERVEQLGIRAPVSTEEEKTQMYNEAKERIHRKKLFIERISYGTYDSDC